MGSLGGSEPRRREGGSIPSVVPEQANIWFFVHAAQTSTVEDLVSEISGEARRLADELDVALDVRRLSQASPWLINRGLAGLVDRALTDSTREPIPRSDEERTFARELQASFGPSRRARSSPGRSRSISPHSPVPVSDDTADASWLVPRGGFLVACYPEGIASHTWQWTAAGTSDFAVEGARRAARTLATAAMTLMVTPETLEAITEEFSRATEARPYQSPLFEGQQPFDHIVQPRR